MGFTKAGDAQPILDYLDENVKVQHCPKCGKKLTLIAVTADENRFVCADCDVADEDRISKN